MRRAVRASSPDKSLIKMPIFRTQVCAPQRKAQEEKERTRQRDCCAPLAEWSIRARSGLWLGTPREGCGTFPEQGTARVMVPSLRLGTNSREKTETPPPHTAARNVQDLKTPTLQARSGGDVLP